MNSTNIEDLSGEWVLEASPSRALYSTTVVGGVHLSTARHAEWHPVVFECPFVREVSQMEKNLDQAPPPPPAPPFRKAGGLVFLSGQVAVDEHWAYVGGELEREARQVFLNISKVLAQSGSSLKDVVFVRTYLSDLANFDAFNVVWRETFGEQSPARTTVQSGLVSPFQIECEVVAMQRHTPNELGGE